MIHISETKPDRNLIIKVQGRQYTVPRPGALQRSVLRAMKKAAMNIATGNASPADHDLIAQINKPQIEDRLLGTAKASMEVDGLKPKQIHDLAVLAFHFHTDGINGADRVLTQLNRKAAA